MRERSSRATRHCGCGAVLTTSRIVSVSRVNCSIPHTSGGARIMSDQAGSCVSPNAVSEITWTGGSFAPAETAPDHPWVGIVSGAYADELGRAVPTAGVPYGADMRHFTARGIPCTMAGTNGLELAHAVDERLPLAELTALSRSMVRVLARSGQAAVR